MRDISKQDLASAIHLLQCAEINCENVAQLRLPVDVVRWQVQEALILLGGQLVTKPVETQKEVRP